MTLPEACLKLASELPTTLLESLTAQLRTGVVPRMPHPAYQQKVDALLSKWPDRQVEIPPMLETALVARIASPRLELVWTGPPTSVVPVRRTEQVLLDLIRNTASQFTITSFGVFNISRIVEGLEDLLDRGVGLRAVLGDRELQSAVEIERQRHQLGNSICARALILHWPTELRPRDAAGRTGLMHAKAAVSDSSVAFLTSANLTDAALERNMELGIVVNGGTIPSAIDRLIDSLIESGELQPFR